jgi:hypothetical protein
MTASRRAGVTAVLGVAGVLAALLFMAWGAAIGPGEIVRGEGPERLTAPSSPSTSDSASAGEGESSGEDQADRSLVPFGAVILALGIVALMVAPFIAVLLVKTVLESVQWHRPDPVEEPPAFEDLVEAWADDLADQEALLLGGPVADGIIGCWQRFERLATDHGLPRRAAETSSEFVLRVLERANADSTAATTLARLYREARFSDHPLGEQERAAALDAVRRIAAGFTLDVSGAEGR